MKTTFNSIALLMILLMSTTNVHAAPIGFADTVIDFFDSGTGALAGPYGGTPTTFPISVSTDVVLGNNTSFLSLPTDSFVTVGFTDNTVIDGPGDDLFIEEFGNGAENAEIFISSDLVNFILLGTAFGNTTTSFDFQTIGFIGAVQAVKIVGLDNGGGSPGFDLVSIEALNVGAAPPSVVPVPAAAWLFGSALLGFFGFSRRKANA